MFLQVMFVKSNFKKFLNDEWLSDFVFNLF